MGKRYKGDEDLPELLEDPVSLLLLLVAVDAHRLIPADTLSNNHSWVDLYDRENLPSTISRIKICQEINDLPMPSHIPGQLVTFSLGFSEHQNLQEFMRVVYNVGAAPPV